MFHHSSSGARGGPGRAGQGENGIQCGGVGAAVPCGAHAVTAFATATATTAAAKAAFPSSQQRLRLPRVQQRPSDAVDARDCYQYPVGSGRAMPSTTAMQGIATNPSGILSK